MLFGGEGLFLAKLSGTGTVWLQSLPFSRMADRIIAHAPQINGPFRPPLSAYLTLGSNPTPACVFAIAYDVFVINPVVEGMTYIAYRSDHLSSDWRLLI